MQNSTNKSFDVFYGEVDALNVSLNKKPIGLVMISRMLWTFSASYNHSKNISYLQFADSVFKYLNNYVTNLLTLMSNFVELNKLSIIH